MTTKIKAPRGLPHETITIGGRTRKFRFCVASMDHAKEQGLPFSEIMKLAPDSDPGDDTEALDVIEELMKFQVALIWLGLLVFEPKLTREQLSEELSFSEIKEAGELAMREFASFMPESPKKDEEDEDDSSGEG